jgi:hypothetical protein
MYTNAIDQKIDAAWHDASLSWQDSVSQKYGAVVIQRLKDTLSSIETMCGTLESATTEALSDLKQYEEE